jgi:hypothetical protein
MPLFISATTSLAFAAFLLAQAVAHHFIVVPLSQIEATQ